AARPPRSLRVALHGPARLTNPSVHEVGRGRVPPQHGVPGTDPNLPFVIAIHFRGPTRIHAAGGGHGLHFLPIPPKHAARPGSNPHRSVGLGQEVVGFPKRSSIRRKNLNEPFGFPTKQPVVRTHPHAPGSIPSCRERRKFSRQTVLGRVTQPPPVAIQLHHAAPGPGPKDAL